MNALFHAHSGLRFLVLLLGFVALGAFFVGQVRGQAFGRFHRIIGTAFAGSLHLQVALGLVMVALGRFYPALIGHLVMMLLAAVLVQVLLIVNRKRPEPGFVLPLLGVVGSLACIAGGVMAIGRGLFTMTAGS